MRGGRGGRAGELGGCERSKDGVTPSVMHVLSVGVSRGISVNILSHLICVCDSGRIGS